ncbi:hypothetical protein H9P43_006842 [Blastocladiella emersonii ATCC 22665]|nr:hypothetical protein H9P43_006842 [Blastocladiella emersonii ATCC 22665]
MQRQSEGAAKVEQLARDWVGFADHEDECNTLLVNPYALKAAGIDVRCIVQNPGDFVMVFSGACHTYFNAGFNCAETVKYALSSWFDEHALRVKYCTCSSRRNQSAL